MNDLVKEYRVYKPYIKCGMKTFDVESVERAFVIADHMQAKYQLDPFIKITEEEAMKEAWQYLELLNDHELINQLQKNLENIKIRYSKDPVEYALGIVWPDLKKHDTLANHKGKISDLIISEISTNMSKIFIAHEMIHALKDTNGNEVVDHYILGETLPLFYELMILNELEFDIVKNHLKYRLNSMADDTRYLKNLKIIKGHNLINQIAISDSCLYLHSYYFALLLYHYYKKNPELIINNVLAVLNQKTTTLDMINDLEIYSSTFSDQIVIEELSEIQRLVLKK